MLGLGLFVGGTSRLGIQTSVAVFPVAVLASLFTGVWLEEPNIVLFTFAVIVCALAALWPKVFFFVVLLMVALGGFLIGQISIPDPGPLRDRVITMTGSLVGASVALIYIAGGAVYVRERYRQKWVNIAFRVVAAWMGAISLVMLALEFAPNTTTS